MTNRRTSTKLLSAFMGLSLLAFAACGDDDDDDDAAPGDTSDTSAPEGDGEEPTGGDLVLGAEQFPECVNPLTQCANSSWMHWAVDLHVLPKLMELDPAGNFIPSPVLDGEPTLSGEGVDEGSSDPFTVTYTPEPRRGVGRRHADHLRRHRVHPAGEDEHDRCRVAGRLRHDERGRRG